MNRRAILEELSQRMNPHLYEFNCLSILMLDIDKFKDINDSFGHIVGDNVLKKVAHVISTAIRGIDSVGRYGGEEFLVIFPNTNQENALIASERIRKMIEETDFEEVHRLTISGGYSTYSNESLEKFIHRADKNLYEAKRSGRNRVVGDPK